MFDTCRSGRRRWSFIREATVGVGLIKDAFTTVGKMFIFIMAPEAQRSKRNKNEAPECLFWAKNQGLP